MIRRIVPDGDQFTLEVEREHQQINELVIVLEGTWPGSPERARLIEQLIGLLFQQRAGPRGRAAPPPQRRSLA